jgi:outer membrane protein OmpA-like peptidoglycan-associated protein
VARGFVGLGWAPDFRDRDHDGVYDYQDLCPDEPEDRDGYRDQDGCPDPDNDSDNIPDAVDKCPSEAEDVDGFQDEDGCPDPDNDGDAIPDLNDACPNAKEDGQGKRPSDGCPSTVEDNDGDGIPDVKDKCPDEPEDFDGFQDDDGCPDIDNDNDGIPDQYDACPNEPEDVDSFEDEDGCPDPDNDKDGIVDAKDKCPLEAETLNGFKDDDGCPDDGAELVELGEKEIEVFERVAFTSGTAQLTPMGRTVVELVAMVMRGHPELATVRIEARGIGVSKQTTQLRADAVAKELTAHGVEPKRLKAVGMGAGSGRVDFIIESRVQSRKAGGGLVAAPADPSLPVPAPQPTELPAAPDAPAQEQP